MESLIWKTKFFEKLADGTTKCLICPEKPCVNCKKSKKPCILASHHNTNAKKHLKLHKEENDQFLKMTEEAAKEEQAKGTKRKATTPSPADFFKPRTCPPTVKQAQVTCF